MSWQLLLVKMTVNLIYYYASFRLYYPYASADIDALYLRLAGGLLGNSITSSSEDEDYAFVFYLYFTNSLPFLSSHPIDQSIYIIYLILYHILRLLI